LRYYHAAVSGSRLTQALGGRWRRELEEEAVVRTQVTVALYVVLMSAVIIAVDVLFFRNRFWERLMANVGIVLVFAAFYFRFLKGP
jgi:preprotein translocase subunit SecE